MTDTKKDLEMKLSTLKYRRNKMLTNGRNSENTGVLRSVTSKIRQLERVLENME